MFTLLYTLKFKDNTRQYGIKPVSYTHLDVYKRQVYIPDAFLALETDLKDIISDFIQMLNSNEKSLQKIASFDYDRQFVLNTRQALSAKNLLDDDQFEEILKNYGDRKAYMKPEQTNILSLEKLARNWNNFDGPYDFTRLLKFKSDVMWLKIAGHASTCLLYTSRCV